MTYPTRVVTLWLTTHPQLLRSVIWVLLFVVDANANCQRWAKRCLGSLTRLQCGKAPLWKSSSTQCKKSWRTAQTRHRISTQFCIDCIVFVFVSIDGLYDCLSYIVLLIEILSLSMHCWSLGIGWPPASLCFAWFITCHFSKFSNRGTHLRDEELCHIITKH